MRILLTLLVAFVSLNTYAQITAPDTVCINTPVNMSTTYEGTTYTWAFDPLNIDQTFTAFTNTSVSGLNTPTFAVMKTDGTNWYAFITNYSSEELIRVDFGTSPLSTTYTVTNLGVIIPGGRMEGIDIVRDAASGNWYGIVGADDKIAMLSFGPTLTMAPAVTTYSVPVMSWVHQVSLQKYGNDWVAFAADRNSYVYRIDFGNGPASAPTAYTTLMLSTTQNPCNFAIYQESGNYYMLVSNLINANITRVNFGSNIQNNAPADVLLSISGFVFNLPRGIIIATDCDQVQAYVANETGNIIKLDFGTSITTTPTASVALTGGTSDQNSLYSYAYGGVQHLMLTNFNSATFSRTTALTYPTGSSTRYYNKTNTHTFTTGGLKTISLLCDEQEIMGQAHYCKNIFVKGGNINLDIRDTAICSGNAVTLDATTTGVSAYQWSTGATSPAISVSTAGTYWVKLTGSACNTTSTFTDTIHVTVTPGPFVGLTDTMTCADSLILLRTVPQPVGNTYLWNTGATGPSIYGSPNNTYWVRVSDGNCTSTDTTTVGLAPQPVVSLGPDTSICGNTTYTLYVNAQPGINSYLWSNGETTANATLPVGQEQWVRVTNQYGCVGSDSITLNPLPVPNSYLGPDTMACNDTLLLSAPANPAGTTYIWSTGATTASILAPGGRKYWLTAGNEFNCSSIDTIELTDLPRPSIELGPDTSMCAGESMALPLGISAYGTSYRWSNGSTQERYTAKETGTVWVEYSNQCYSTRDTITIQVRNCQIFFPNAFSPDGDGLNDIARLKGYVDELSDYELAIFNRWGNMVYRTNSPTEGWDGRYKGTAQQTGVYTWYIKYKFRGEPDVLKGNITLLR